MATSFSVYTDVSQDSSFNSAVGFTQIDVLQAIESCLGYSFTSKESKSILATLTHWGDGYGFSACLSATEGMYQSVMVVQLLRARRATHNFDAGYIFILMGARLASTTRQGAAGLLCAICGDASAFATAHFCS